VPAAFPADLVVEIDPHPSAPAAARRELRVLLGAGAGLRPDLVRDVLVVGSELVTNALVHAGGRSTLAAWASPAQSWVRLEVADTSRQLPRIHHQAPARVRGWGLPLVMRLVSRWGVETRAGGKSVWCELQRPDRAGSAAEHGGHGAAVHA